MTAPGEKPVDIRFESHPSVGRKRVLMDGRGSEAYLAGLAQQGVEAHRTLVGDDLYAITIDKL